MLAPRKVLPHEGGSHCSSVLVVEGDPEQQVPLAHAARAQGHRVVGTSSVAGAIALVSEWPVDLVLIGQEQPGTTGIDMIRALLRVHPNLRVVLLTQKDSPGLRLAARHVGAYDCALRSEMAPMLAKWLGYTSFEPEGHMEAPQELADSAE